MGSAFLGNEDLGKKNDDHKPTKVSSIRPPWSGATRPSPRKTLKRLAIVLALGIFVYLFVKNLPTDVPIRDRRRPVYEPQPVPDQLPPPGPMPKLKPDRRPIGPPETPSSEPSLTSVKNYNGPIKFLKLASTLRAISTTGGSSHSNRNVLFAAASLKSVGLLLPMACKMGEELRNYVHFALMGGTEIEMEKLRIVNMIDDSCQVVFHGALQDPGPSFALRGDRQLTQY